MELKTNIVMCSSDRELFGYKIRQQTKDGMLNLSDLQEAYTRARIVNGWTDRDISNILNSDVNKERIFYILEKQGFIKPHIRGFMERVNNEGLAKYLKSLGVWKTTGARHTKTVWINPYIWVMVAMEMNPMLYGEVIGWLTDSLIINRIEAGNFYKELSRAITKFENVDYVAMARALNYCIFNKHETGLRNLATKEELKDMQDLEGKMAFAIDMGYINSFDELLAELRKIWNKKWNDKESEKLL